MARPGVNVISRSAPPVRSAPSDTGVWFVAGLTAKGPVGEAVHIRNLPEFTRIFGSRVNYSGLYDALDIFFREGGTRAYVSRIVGPAATTASINLKSGVTDVLRVEAIGPGESDLSIAVVAGSTAGSFAFVVTDGDDVEVLRSPAFNDTVTAAAWAETSDYIRLSVLDEGNPDVVGATALATATDDRDSITDDERIAALDAFTRQLGPGQVSIPGATTTAVHNALLNNAFITNRVALLDAPNSSSDVSLIAAADAVRVENTDEVLSYGAMFGDWLRIPGLVRNTTRVVPPSAVVAGLISRSDAVTGNPNVPAAGRNGETRSVLGTVSPGWSDVNRESLNEAGVSTFRDVYGGIRLYGYRTLVDTGPGADDSWLSLAAARLRMAIVNDSDAQGEAFVFAQIDGRRRKISEFGGALIGMLQRYYLLGALYGETADEAFIVDVGPTVNTPETIADQQLRAAIGIRTSPFAEMVTIEIVKVSVTEAL